MPPQPLTRSFGIYGIPPQGLGPWNATMLRGTVKSAENILRVSMELGGNAPFLVFDDADIDAAVDGAMLAKMRNIGEACTAANRFFVHESLAEEFSTRLAERMGELVVGRGTDEGVHVGPLITERARDGVHTGMP